METVTQSPSGSAPPPAFSMTENAASRINALKSQEGKPGLRFRVTVKGGGCSGFQYEFNLDDGDPASTDMVIAQGGAEVVIDDVSLGLVRGSVLDYEEDLSSAGFEIKNP